MRCPWKILVPLAGVFLLGCLTPENGRQADAILGFDSVPRAREPWQDDDDLPARLWYVDPEARIYHERRSNTFIAWDKDHEGWIAISEARARCQFHPERAKLLLQGPPSDVEKVLDYCEEMDPSWHGLP